MIDSVTIEAARTLTAKIEATRAKLGEKFPGLVALALSSREQRRSKEERFMALLKLEELFPGLHRLADLSGEELNAFLVRAYKRAKESVTVLARQRYVFQGLAQLINTGHNRRHEPRQSGRRWREAEMANKLLQLKLEKLDVRSHFAKDVSTELIVACMNVLDTDDPEVGIFAARAYQDAWAVCGPYEEREPPNWRELLGIAFGGGGPYYHEPDTEYYEPPRYVYGPSSDAGHYEATIRTSHRGEPPLWQAFRHDHRAQGRTTAACHDCIRLLQEAPEGATIYWFLPTHRWLEHIKPMLSRLLEDRGYHFQWFRGGIRSVLECNSRRVYFAYLNDRHFYSPRYVVNDYGEAADYASRRYAT